MKREACLLCGHKINIITEDPKEWSQNGMGRSNTGYLTIRIKEGLPKDARYSTLLHEIIHMIADMNTLKSITDDETAVSVFANSLFAWMRDNKSLVSKIICDEGEE
jgi:hypothetical protein